MRAGRLREVIEIQSQAESANDYGQQVKTWSTLATTRAEVKPISALETETGGKTESRTIYQFTFRYQSALNERNRIVWNSDNYHISEILNLNARNKTHVIKAHKDG